MYRRTMYRLILLPTLISIIPLLSACVGSTQQSEEGEQRTYPTVFITPMITQIVATRPAPTPAPEEEPTPTEVNPSSWDPFKVNIYYPIRDCVASRLRIGDPAYVAYNSGIMAIYPDEDIWFAPPKRRLEVGEALLIVEGPWCKYNTIIWKVKTLNKEENEKGVNNYVPEGNGEQYWLLPLQTNPGIPTPKPTNISARYRVLISPIKGCGGRR